MDDWEHSILGKKTKTWKYFGLRQINLQCWTGLQVFTPTQHFLFFWQTLGLLMTKYTLSILEEIEEECMQIFMKKAETYSKSSNHNDKCKVWQECDAILEFMDKQFGFDTALLCAPPTQKPLVPVNLYKKIFFFIFFCNIFFCWLIGSQAKQSWGHVNSPTTSVGMAIRNEKLSMVCHQQFINQQIDTMNHK